MDINIIIPIDLMYRKMKTWMRKLKNSKNRIMILVKRHTSMTDIIIIAKERKENLTGIALVIRENTVFILGNSERSGIIIKNIGVIVLLSIVE